MFSLMEDREVTQGQLFWLRGISPVWSLQELSGILFHKAGTETVVIPSCASVQSWSHLKMNSLFSLGPLLWEEEVPGVMWLLEGGSHGNYTENGQCISPSQQGDTARGLCPPGQRQNRQHMLESVVRTLQGTCTVQSSTSLFLGGLPFSPSYFE